MTEGNYELDIDVAFGGVSIGDHTARLGVKIDREDMDLDAADEFFSGKRLQAKVMLQDRADEAQRRLTGMEDDGPPSIETVVDVNGFRATPKNFSAGLTFDLSTIDVQDLARFAKQSGILRADCIGVTEPQSDDDDDDGFADPDPKRKSRKARGSRSFPQMELVQQLEGLAVELDGMSGESLSVLTAGRLKKLLGDRYVDKTGLTAKKVEAVQSACGSGTLGGFEQWMKSNPYWERDIKGLGEEWITKLQDAHLALRLAYPIPTEDDVKERRESIYRAGCEANAENKPRSENPHPEESAAAAIWDAGWAATDAERDADEGTVLDGGDDDGSEEE